MSILNTVGKEVNNNTLEDTGLNWTVEKTECLTGQVTGGTATTFDKVATVRTDTHEVLGIVGKDYQVVQNQELAYMAERISGSAGLKIDTAGELRNGARVWLSIKAPSFNVGTKDDEIKPYLLLTNGHDGLFSLSGTPTSVRTWCENTLNMALRSGRRENMCISIRHKGDMNEKMEGLMDTLSQFYARSDNFQKQASYMAGTKINDSQQLNDYFRAIYNETIQKLPDTVQDSKDQRTMNKFHSTMMKWYDVYDTESAHLGSNMWVAFNAVTNYLDHSTSFRGKKKDENRFYSNFYGANAIRKQKILESTLAMA